MLNLEWPDKGKSMVHKSSALFIKHKEIFFQAVNLLPRNGLRVVMSIDRICNNKKRALSDWISIF